MAPVGAVGIICPVISGVMPCCVEDVAGWVVCGIRPPICIGALATAGVAAFGVAAGLAAMLAVTSVVLLESFASCLHWR